MHNARKHLFLVITSTSIFDYDIISYLPCRKWHRNRYSTDTRKCLPINFPLQRPMTAEILGTHHSTSCLSFGFPFSLLLITLLYKLYQSSELKYTKMLVLCFETVLSLTDLLLTTSVSVNVCVCVRLFVCVCVCMCAYTCSMQCLWVCVCLLFVSIKP